MERIGTQLRAYRVRLGLTQAGGGRKQPTGAAVGALGISDFAHLAESH